MALGAKVGTEARRPVEVLPGEVQSWLCLSCRLPRCSPAGGPWGPLPDTRGLVEGSRRQSFWDTTCCLRKGRSLPAAASTWWDPGRPRHSLHQVIKASGETAPPTAPSPAQRAQRLPHQQDVKSEGDAGAAAHRETKQTTALPGGRSLSSSPGAPRGFMFRVFLAGWRMNIVCRPTMPEAGHMWGQRAWRAGAAAIRTPRASGRPPRSPAHCGHAGCWMGDRSIHRGLFSSGSLWAPCSARPWAVIACGLLVPPVRGIWWLTSSLFPGRLLPLGV